MPALLVRSGERSTGLDERGYGSAPRITERRQGRIVISGRARGLGKGHVVLPVIDVARQKGGWFKAPWELE